jgi:hypothetical protein
MRGYTVMQRHDSQVSFFGEHLGFLKKLGFEGPRTRVEQSDLLGEYICLVYESKLSDRKIDVSYVSSSAIRSVTVAVLIYNGEGESFSLEDWQNAKSPSVMVHFSKDAIIPDDKTFLANFSKELQHVFEGPLSGTLRGAEWDSVPFDWKGYR